MTGLPYHDCSDPVGTPLFSRRLLRAEKSISMRVPSYIKQAVSRTGQDHVELVLFSVLLFALLLTSLTLTGLARLTGLRSLVGLTTMLATSTA